MQETDRIYSKPSRRKTAEALSTESRASAPGCPLRSGASDATEFFIKRLVTNEKRSVRNLSGARHARLLTKTYARRPVAVQSNIHPGQNLPGRSV